MLSSFSVWALSCAGFLAQSQYPCIVNISKFFWEAGRMSALWPTCHHQGPGASCLPGSLGLALASGWLPSQRFAVLGHSCARSVVCCFLLKRKSVATSQTIICRGSWTVLFFEALSYKLGCRTPVCMVLWFSILCSLSQKPGEKRECSSQEQHRSMY